MKTTTMVWQADHCQIETIQSLQNFFKLGSELLVLSSDAELKIRCSLDNGDIEFQIQKNDERPLGQICLPTNLEETFFDLMEEDKLLLIKLG
jgi:hypothetical protein